MYSNFFGCCLQYFFLFFFVLLVFELICFFFLSLFPSRRTHCTISVLLKYSSVVVHISYNILYVPQLYSCCCSTIFVAGSFYKS